MSDYLGRIADLECTCGDIKCRDCYPTGFLSRREKDHKIINRWRTLEKSGDPPLFVQRAFDREQVRMLE